MIGRVSCFSFCRIVADSLVEMAGTISFFSKQYQRIPSKNYCTTTKKTLENQTQFLAGLWKLLSGWPEKRVGRKACRMNVWIPIFPGHCGEKIFRVVKTAFDLSTKIVWWTFFIEKKTHNKTFLDFEQTLNSVVKTAIHLFRGIFWEEIKFWLFWFYWTLSKKSFKLLLENYGKVVKYAFFVSRGTSCVQKNVHLFTPIWQISEKKSAFLVNGFLFLICYERK